MKIGDMLQGEVTSTEETISQMGLRNSSARLLPSGTVIISIFATIGRTAVLRLDAATNQAIAGLTLRDPGELMSEYLRLFLDAAVSELERRARGVAQANINLGILRALQVPLPPLDEQRNIVTVLGKVETLRVRRREALARLGELTRSVFIDMFGNPATNPRRLPLVTIGEMIQSANYGTSEKAGSEGEFPVLRMNNLTRTGEIDVTNLKYMNLPISKRDRYLVRRGDVLFNRTNSPELVGKTAIYRAEKQVAYAGYLVRLRTNALANPEYLAAFLNTERSKAVLRGMCKSIIGMANINAKEVQGMVIPLAPLDVQEQFARRIEAIERLKVNHRVHLAELDVLFASLQYRAFRGEL